LLTNNIWLYLKPRNDIKEQTASKIFLGGGKVDPTLLARVIESFYNSNPDVEDKPDRRKYKGKHQEDQLVQDNMSNSPFVIQLKT
jgi:hypothetical protein